MKYWHADVQFCNSVKHGYTGLYIHMQKSIYKNIVMHYYFYYYYNMSELILEVFQNRFRSCRKSSNSLAFWNLETNVLPTNVVPDDVMATLKHLSQIGFRKGPVCNVHCSILQYSWLLIMDMPIVDVKGHEAQQLANYDMPAVFSDDDGSAQRSKVEYWTAVGNT
jgi:hypothetical protein